MRKNKMSRGALLTFEEGCKKYLENCRQRNSREGTIIDATKRSTSVFAPFKLFSTILTPSAVARYKEVKA